MTYDDIARELGVSKSTVSRALSGKGRIGKETRDKIMEYVKETQTSELTGKPAERTNCIGVVIPADAYCVSIPFFQECLLGICESASMMNYHVQITTGTVNDISGIRSLVENNRIDGAILMRGVEGDMILKYLTEIKFPTGLTGLCKYEDVIQVDTDIVRASENLTDILIGSGYRKFAIVVGSMSYVVNQSRCEGIFDALKNRGLSVENQVFCPNFENTDLIDSVIDNIIYNKVECVICGDDVICTKLMSKLQAEGYRIPKDISIVSLYNSVTLDCFSSAVTAINISARKTGNTIGKQLINYLQGNEYNRVTMLDYEILFRASTNRKL